MERLLSTVLMPLYVTVHGYSLPVFQLVFVRVCNSFHWKLSHMSLWNHLKIVILPRALEHNDNDSTVKGKLQSSWLGGFKALFSLHGDK